MGVLRRGRWAIVLGYAVVIAALLGLGYLAYLTLAEGPSSRYRNIQKLRGEAVTSVRFVA